VPSSETAGFEWFIFPGKSKLQRVTGASIFAKGSSVISITLEYT